MTSNNADDDSILKKGRSTLYWQDTDWAIGRFLQTRHEQFGYARSRRKLASPGETHGAPARATKSLSGRCLASDDDHAREPSGCVCRSAFWWAICFTCRTRCALANIQLSRTARPLGSIAPLTACFRGFRRGTAGRSRPVEGSYKSDMGCQIKCGLRHIIPMYPSFASFSGGNG